MKEDNDKLKLKHQKASKKVAELKMMLEDQNEELERAYHRLNDKDNEIRNLQRKMLKERHIRIEYQHIIESYNNIITEMRI